MNSSTRCTATAVIVLSALATDVQAFTCAAVRNSACFGDSYRATNTLRSSTSMRSLGSSASRTARCGPLAMSEMAEDYPSDTGDDRFSTGGERVWWCLVFCPLQLNSRVPVIWFSARKQRSNNNDSVKHELVSSALLALFVTGSAPSGDSVHSWGHNYSS